MKAKNHIYRMQQQRWKLFEAQDNENSTFDVTFEIDGKNIYANKYILETISDTFKAMLSDRWRSKDEVVKLETYSFDTFYQFLTFIYSGSCDLTPENVSTMVEMADFYNVAAFKDFCDEYVSNIELSTENVFDWVTFVSKYNLAESKISIDRFTRSNFENILQSDQFMNLQKSSIELLVTFKRGPNQEEALFEAVYKWAENQFAPEESTVKRKYVNTNEGMKAELSGILPHIKFDKMKPCFLYKFVVSKGFLFTYEELSAMLYEFNKITVTVTDRNGRTLTGSFVDNFNMYDEIKLMSAQKRPNGLLWYFTVASAALKRKELEKNNNVHFYLLCSKNNCYRQLLSIKKYEDIDEKDYLLAEMTGNDEFVFDHNNCKINVIRNCFAS